MPSLTYYENLRDQLITDKYRVKLNEVLTDIKAFETLDAGYEFLDQNSGQIARALRNLDDAIAGKEYARDAVFTALNYVLESIKTICKEEAESETLSADEMKLNREKFGDE